VSAFSERGELAAVPRQQCLVGRNHRFAGGERGLDGALCRISRTANQLDENINVGILRQLLRIGDPSYFFEINTAIFSARACADRDDLYRAAATCGQRLSLARQLGDQSRADCA